MGIDFIAAKRRFFKKAHDGGRAVLEMADLFVVEQTTEDQSVVFEVHEPFVLLEGEEIAVHISGDTLVALRESIIATATNPPATVLAALRRAHGVALGRVVGVSPLSRTANIAFHPVR